VDGVHYLQEVLEVLEGEHTFTANAESIFYVPRVAARLNEHNNESSQAGNFANQQGTSQRFSIRGENEFEGGEISFAPENETECEQAVQQSSFGLMNQ